MLILDRIGDFNEVIEYYGKLLEIVRMMTPNLKMKYIENKIFELLDDKYFIPAIRTIIMGKSLEIMQIEELINQGKVDDTKVSDAFKRTESFEEIQELVPMSKQEKMRQIRNCLAHAMYEIRINDESITNLNDLDEQSYNISLYINNGKVKGTIPYNDFYILISSYKEIYSAVLKKDKGLLTCNNNKLDEQNEKKALNTFVGSMRLGKESLSEEEKKLVKGYIKWIGLGNFKSMDLLTRSRILIDFVYLSQNGVFSNYFSGANLSNEFIDTLRHYNYRDENTEASFGFSRKTIVEKNCEKFGAQTPIIYASILLGLSSYCFAYIREINSSRGEEIFSYMNIDLPELDATFKNPEEKAVKEINLSSVLKEKNRQKKAILKYRTKIEQIQDPEKRRQVIEKCKEDLEKGRKQEETLDAEIAKLEQQIRISGNIAYDSSNFFRHLRNSISHGRYNIDYMKFFRTKKIDDIMFKFQDYAENSGSADFEVTMNAKRMFELIGAIQGKINDTIEKSSSGEVTVKSYLREALVHFGIDSSDLDTETRKYENDRKGSGNIVDRSK